MRKGVVVGLVALAVASAGCGSTDSATPVACLEGKGVYLRALERAPGAVRLRRETPISDCLAENQQGGDLATVGTAIVGAATELNAAAREDPGGPANLQLGYLLGAVRVADERTDGIHTELTRRLSTAVSYSPDDQALPLVFIRTLTKGLSAGETHG